MKRLTFHIVLASRLRGAGLSPFREAYGLGHVALCFCCPVLSAAVRCCPLLPAAHSGSRPLVREPSLSALLTDHRLLCHAVTEFAVNYFLIAVPFSCSLSGSTFKRPLGTEDPCTAFVPVLSSPDGAPMHTVGLLHSLPISLSSPEK